ncbi:MAG: hypothetical protein LBG52_06985 [Candidatus Peribacteria bacterium]|jgi:hypothetical protein|nr:hypothetical protein [Candidatus Peribacteria bacterium]
MTEKIINPKKIQEPKTYAEFNSYRPLTFVEESVNRKRYAEKITSLENDFSAEFKKVADLQKEAIIKQVKEALDNNDFAQLANIKTTSKELTNLIAEIRKQSFEF